MTYEAIIGTLDVGIGIVALAQVALLRRNLRALCGYFGVHITDDHRVVPARGTSAHEAR